MIFGQSCKQKKSKNHNFLKQFWMWKITGFPEIILPLFLRLGCFNFPIIFFPSESKSYEKKSWKIEKK